MYIQAFPVSATNVFPMANSTKGGQLATEFNMRSRESVATDSTIQYMVGPTYLHSERDFVVSRVAGSNTKLVISAGRGVINGHFVETLSDIEIDIAAANASSTQPVSGDLVIGIRMMYADTALSGGVTPLSAYAGALAAEDNDTQMYKGLQIVILPADQFKLPIDVPTNEAQVTAHIKLATFRYINGAIRGNVENVPFAEHSSVISASRISGIDTELNSTFISSTGLQPNKLYTFAGKPVVDDHGNVVTSGSDTWCDSTDSIMVWDSNPQAGLAADVNNSRYGNVQQASYAWNAETQSIDLVVPHKQIDGGMIENNTNDRYKYYPKVISIGSADFNDLNSHGLVNGAYTAAIMQKFNEMDARYMFHSQAVQRAYIPTLSNVSDLPVLSQQEPAWHLYDYVLVGQDFTQVAESDSTRSPATIYMVNQFVISLTDQLYDEDPDPTARHLPSVSHEFETHDALSYYINFNMWRNDILASISSLPDAAPGNVIPALYYVAEDEVTYWYYATVLQVGQVYSDAIWLTNEISLSTETTVGGFINVSDTQTGQGYVYMDPEGHLRVLDYGLLASGALAYQLGHDQTFPNLTVAELQTQLDEYVNDRVMFPDVTQLTSTYSAIASGDAVDPSVINITIQLPDDSSEDAQTIYINDLDSRFNSSAFVHIHGSATSNTTVEFRNCQKLRIDNNIEGTPNIRLVNCELFYDAGILNYASEISGLSLWYALNSSDYESAEAQRNAPQICVDGMTVYQKNVPLVAQDIDAFSAENINDLHYSLGLDSITFDEYGDVVGCSVRISDSITSNNSDVESFVVATFNLPQGGQLVYPYKHMTKPIKVAGTFMSSYPVQPSAGNTYTHHLHKTDFTLITTPYDATSLDMESSQQVPCTLSVDTQVRYVNPAVYSYDSFISSTGYVIPGLESGSAYVFSGRINS